MADILKKSESLFDLILAELMALSGIEVVAHANYPTRFQDINRLGEIVIRYNKPTGNRDAPPIRDLAGVRRALSKNLSMGEGSDMTDGVEYGMLVGTAELHVHFDNGAYTDKALRTHVIDRVWVREKGFITEGEVDGYFERNLVITNQKDPEYSI